MILKQKFCIKYLIYIIKIQFLCFQSYLAQDISTTGKNYQNYRQTQSQIGQNDNQILPIFKPQPIFQTDSLEYCENSLNSQTLDFQVNGVEYIALSLQTCGFMIYNLQDPSFPKVELFQKLKGDGYVNRFSFDDQRYLLLIAYSSGYIYSVDLLAKPFTCQQSLQTHNQVQPLFVQIIPGVNDILLIICYGEIQVFSAQQSLSQINLWQVITNFNYYKTIQLANSNNILKIQISQSNELMFIGSYTVGVSIYKIVNINSQDIFLSFIAIINPSFLYLTWFHLTSKNILYYQIEYGGILGLDLNDCITAKTNAICIKLKIITNFYLTSKAGQFVINKEETFLFSQFRQFGIKSFDLQNGTTRTFQTIEIYGDTQDIKLNHDGSLLFYTNSFQFLIYQRSNDIQNFGKPNILLNIIQISEFNSYKVGQEFGGDSCCFYDEQREFIYLCRYQFGISVFKKQSDGIVKNIKNIDPNLPQQLIGDFKFMNDGKIMYVPKNFNGLSIIDFTDPYNPVYLKENLKFGVQQPLFSTIICNNQKTLCGIGSQYTGIIFINIQNILDPQFESIFHSKFLDNSVQYAYSTFLNKVDVFITVIHQYGLIFVDIADSKNPVQISSIKTDESTYTIVTNDDQYCLCTSSFRGLIILDISDVKNPRIISQVKLFGAIIKVRFLDDERYALITSYENSGLFLVDIQDKYNPVLIQTLKKKKTYGFYEACLTKDESKGFLSSQGGLLFISMKNQIKIHVEMYQVANIYGTNNKQYITLNTSKPLFVGQNINIFIIPLYEDQPIAIKNAQLYQDYLLQPLKSWMVFQPEQFLLELNIFKDSLQQQKDGSYIETSQQIIFQVHKTLLQNNFINDFLQIDSTLSTKIFKELQDSGYIDELGMAADTINPQTNLNIDLISIFGSAKISDKETKDNIIRSIKYVLQHSIIYYPIEFKIAPSIQINLSNPNGDYIFSLQQQVIIHIQIMEKGSGSFVNRNYPGVLCVISQAEDEIKIEGDTQKVNQILKQKIKFSSKYPSNQIVFIVDISDGINYDLINEIPYSKAIFISEQQKVKVENENILQNDFSSKVQNSEIYILERFQYQISNDIFQGEQGSSLTYSAQMKDKSGQYTDFPINFWLQFSATDKMFSGTPSQKDFNEIIYIQVKVTDGYSSIISYFEIQVTKVPLSYIIQIFFQIVGPLLGLLGIWKYKYQVYNCIYKKQYTYSKELIFAGQIYSKQIILNDHNIQCANKILDYFIKNIPKQYILKQIYLFYSQQKKIKCDNLKHFEIEMDLTSNRILKSQTNQQNSPRNDNEINQFESLVQTEKSINPLAKYIKSEIDSEQDQIIEMRPTINLQKSQLQYLPRKQTVYSKRISKEGRVTINNNPLNQEQDNQVQINQNNPKNVEQSNNQPSLQRQESNNQSIIMQDRTMSLSRKSKITTSVFQKQITKKMENQIQKINKAQQDQSIFDKSSRISSDPSNSKKISDENDFQLLNEQGYIQYDSIILYLIRLSQNQNILSKNRLSDKLIQQLQVKTGLVRQTFESFIAEYIIQKDQFSYHVFQQLMKRANLPANIPDWYKTYCNITTNLNEIQNNPIPQINFKDEEIVKAIKSSLFEFNQQYQDSFQIDKIPISIPIIKDTIKAYALGFVSQHALYRPSSSGESVRSESHNIKQIASFTKRKSSILELPQKQFFKKVKNSLQSQYIEKPLIDNNKLPSWIKSVDIINHNLLIIGQPEKKDVGSYHIFVYTKRNFILRAYEIIVLDFENGHEVTFEKNQIFNFNNSQLKADQLQSLDQILSKKISFNEENIRQRHSSIDIKQTEIQRKSSLEQIQLEEKLPHTNEFTDL